HRRAPAQRGGGGRPDRVHQRGPDAVARDEAVEGGEVGGFLGVHVLHQGAQVGMRAQERGGLGGVD
ncbi:MAG: hypothetical protein Q9193_005788, partial [Seirophora villosa]